MTGMAGMGGGLIVVLLVALGAGVLFALRNRRRA
jgi:MYXO-CTERM domain-containing protein